MPSRFPNSDESPLGQALMAQSRLEQRVNSAESAIEVLTGKVTRLAEPRLENASFLVPIQTFAPEPFDLLKPIIAVVRADENAFVATLFDANISSGGDTPRRSRLKSQRPDPHDLPGL